MITKKEVLSALEFYRLQFPEETAKTDRFREFVSRFKDTDLYNRKNFTGHLTTGGIISSRRSRRILLLKHNQLKKWLQPGGHIEAEDSSLMDAACREIREETGIGRDELRPLSFSRETVFPVDIDCHYIGPCEAKREDEHYHFDLRFAFLFGGADEEVMIDRRESGGYKWVTLPEFAAIDEFRNLAPKIACLLDNLPDE